MRTAAATLFERTTIFARTRKVPALSILAFLCGLGSTFKLNLLGEIYLCELLLPIVGIIAVAKTKPELQVWRTKAFRLLLLGLILTLCGYVISDLVRETTPDQYLRGWGRVLLLMSNFLALCAIIGADRRNLWWFAIGFGIGGTLYLRLGMHLPISIWKHGYSEVVSVGYAAVGALISPPLAALGFLGLTFYSFLYDFRIHGAICIFLSMLLLRSRRMRDFKVAKPSRLAALVGVGVIGLACAVAITKLSEDDYNKARRDVSNDGRSVGLEVGLRGIFISPLIGHGSWGVSSDLRKLQAEVAQERLGERAQYFVVSGSALLAHSQLIGSWLEGGVLGAAFFIALGVLLVRNAVYATVERPLDAISAIVLYYSLYGIWHLIMSMFSATSRMQIAISAAVVVILSAEREMAVRKLSVMRKQRQSLQSSFKTVPPQRARI